MSVTRTGKQGEIVGGSAAIEIGRSDESAEIL
jgi:hypothetical protein